MDICQLNRGARWHTPIMLSCSLAQMIGSLEIYFRVFFIEALTYHVTPSPGRVYSTTTVGAYKSFKCHIVVFWRLK